MNQQIANHIVNALNAVEKYLAEPVSTGKPDSVSKEYDGYAASFTASLVISGLRPTLAFYTDVHKMRSDAQKEAKAVRRYKLLQALHHVLVPPSSVNSPKVAANALLFWVMKEVYGPGALEANNKLENPDEKRLSSLQVQITDAAVALKLALRNFKQVETSTQND